ncbi:hypothetical protein L9F63_010407, partial [Diploptera punctata]
IYIYSHLVKDRASPCVVWKYLVETLKIIVFITIYKRFVTQFQYNLIFLTSSIVFVLLHVISTLFMLVLFTKNTSQQDILVITLSIMNDCTDILLVESQDFLLIGICFIIKHGFKKINLQLQEMPKFVKEYNRLQTRLWKPRITVFVTKKDNNSKSLNLLTLMNSCDFLCELCENVNYIFSVRILISVAHKFCCITGSLYFILIQIMFIYDFEYIPSIVISVIHFCTKSISLVIILHQCSSTSYEANRTAILVHKLLNKTEDPEVREELQLFSLQLLHRKVQFTACGFFPLDFTLLYSIIGAVTTYLVILIQFQLTFNDKNN